MFLQQIIVLDKTDVSYKYFCLYKINLVDIYSCKVQICDISLFAFVNLIIFPHEFPPDFVVHFCTLLTSCER